MAVKKPVQSARARTKSRIAEVLAVELSNETMKYLALIEDVKKSKIRMEDLANQIADEALKEKASWERKG